MMKMQFRRILLFTAAVALAVVFFPVQSTALAQDEGEKARVIQDIIDLLKEEMWLERALEATVHSLPVEQQDSARDVLSRIDHDAMYNALAEAADEIYTTEELKAYFEYRSTDVGRSTLRKEVLINGKIYEILFHEVMQSYFKKQ